MLVQHLLDLARIDVVPVADDHVLQPVDDEEVALVIDRPRSPVASQPSAETAAPPPRPPVPRDHARARNRISPISPSGTRAPSTTRSSVPCPRAAGRPSPAFAARPSDRSSRSRRSPSARTPRRRRRRRSPRTHGSPRSARRPAEMREPQRRQRGPSEPHRRARCTSSGRRATPSSRSRPSSPSVSTGSNRGTTATVPPVASVAISPVDCPRTCENGAAPSTTSSGPKAERLGGVCERRRTMLPWVRTAPLETPEVPEVKRITAGIAGIALDERRVFPAASLGVERICVTPSRSAVRRLTPRDRRRR